MPQLPKETSLKYQKATSPIENLNSSSAYSEDF